MLFLFSPFKYRRRGIRTEAAARATGGGRRAEAAGIGRERGWLLAFSSGHDCGPKWCECAIRPNMHRKRPKRDFIAAKLDWSVRFVFLLIVTCRKLRYENEHVRTNLMVLFLANFV